MMRCKRKADGCVQRPKPVAPFVGPNRRHISKGRFSKGKWDLIYALDSLGKCQGAVFVELFLIALNEILLLE
jgi:hypothetical protein